ncbi:MAG: hypothetical protein L0Y66_25455, partial [Myxococcaceae bacterium]|nr:hypothetical protein [Myxococcaceae bacterium]
CDADTGVCSPVASLPFAFTNPVFVDADGSGAYDAFPLAGATKLALPLTALTQHADAEGPFVLTVEQLEAFFHHMAEHSHR